jgi:hypothetical protein
MENLEQIPMILLSLVRLEFGFPKATFMFLFKLFFDYFKIHLCFFLNYFFDYFKIQLSVAHTPTRRRAERSEEEGVVGLAADFACRSVIFLKIIYYKSICTVLS